MAKFEGKKKAKFLLRFQFYSCLNFTFKIDNKTFSSCDIFNYDIPI